MKVYIVTEIMSRELIGNLILAALLASRGHVAIVLNQEDAYVLGRGSVSGTTIFHAKSLHGAEERIRQHAKLRKSGFIITSMDQESAILSPAVPTFVSKRFSQENLEMAERVYTWNQLEARELSKQFPEFSGKVLAYGSPRVDSWGARFRGLGGPPNAARRQILLTPSVSMNSPIRHWEHLAIARTVLKGGARPVEDLSHAYKSHADELRSQVFFSQLALKVADAFPEDEVTIQPKKGEIRDSWVKSLYAFDTVGEGSRPNLKFEYSRILEESVHGADVVVNSTSTAGLTALIGGVPLISFGPTESMASELGSQVVSVDQALARVSEALAEPQRFVRAYEAKNLKMLGDRITISDSRLAAEAIVEDMENLDSGLGGRTTNRDFLFYLFPGSVRRALSAIKALMKLQRPVRADPEMVTMVGQARLNALLGRIVDAIGIEARVRAKVAGGRNIVVSIKPSIRR